MTPRISILVGAAGLAVLGLGCDAKGFTSKGAKAPTTTPTAPVGEATTTGANGGWNASNVPVVQTAGMTVSNEIAQACGIQPRPQQQPQQQYAARFEFDSAALGQEDREMLSLVAKCLTEGAL